MCEREVIGACRECGGSGTLMEDDGEYLVRCHQCGATSCNMESITEAIENWNLNCTERGDEPKDYQKIILAVREVLNNPELCAEAMVAEIGELVE